MANEDKVDEFALTAPNGLPAYPQMVYKPTGEKHKDGSPIMDAGHIVKSPDEHKEYLKQAKAPAWGDKDDKK